MMPRTLEILVYLHRAGPARLVDVGQEIDLRLSGTYRSLTQLARRGLVEHSGPGGTWAFAFPDIDPLKEYELNAKVPGHELMLWKARGRHDG